MPKLLSKGERQRKRRLQRKLARQVKGSNRRNKTKLAIAKLSAKESDRRKDWIEKTTTELVRNYDLIALEDLKVKNMTRSAKGTSETPGKNVAQKRGLNRAILEQLTGIVFTPRNEGMSGIRRSRGLSMSDFFSRYGTEEQCRKALLDRPSSSNDSRVDGRRMLPASWTSP
jgi:hypothetical protein